MSTTDIAIVAVQPIHATVEYNDTIRFIYYPVMNIFCLGPALVKCDPETDSLFEQYFGLSFANTVYSPNSNRTVTNGCIIHVWMDGLYGGRFYFRVVNPLTHLFRLRRIQRLWLRRQELRRLAVAMALHQRLGSRSALGGLGRDMLRLVCHGR